MSAQHDVRTLTDPAQRRAAYDLFLSTLHRGPAGDEAWEAHGHAGDEHWLGVVDPDGEIVGSANSFPSRLTLPGGARVPAAAVSGVGVRADRTRAGRLTALMRAQLTAARERGDTVTVLRASEAAIYGRYGYGVASRGQHVRVTARPAWRADAPAGGRVRLLGTAEAGKILPDLQERLAADRPGGMTRNPRWWRRAIDPGGPSAGEYKQIGVHTGPDGDDGFAIWGISEGEPGGNDTISVQQMWAGSPAATAGLWRFLTGADLSDAVTAWARPLDEDLDLLLTDGRAHRVTGRSDDLWLRIVDVGAALAARSWGSGDPVVLRLHDPVLDDAGTWRIGPGGVRPAGDALPELECGLESLAPAFLGDRTPSALAAAGRWTEHVPGAAVRADALFAVPGPAPWSGTFF
ncbi:MULTISPECIES: GNAT family N-acetyltransferase [unclassified Pseudonocardia]|uniref:GNAT family N-acetyltransferase n=1 Tax=unclassified Pseudonocardia TaxID=2619320 RepID=UPI00094AC73D|nr:GNAT family N-acetyltransferase [Pseudonocardia sp. Ae707_Ps1]OLM18681.1 Enhanced intracellular survival protein [Pseudonocardia sp. Ae707_Ps1]